MQTTTVYAFGRSSRSLVPIANIHDIVINEVIVDVSSIYSFHFGLLFKYQLSTPQIQVIYVLNILTKGESFRKTPVIPLMVLNTPQLTMMMFRHHLDCVFFLIIKKLLHLKYELIIQQNTNSNLAHTTTIGHAGEDIPGNPARSQNAFEYQLSRRFDQDQLE